MISKIGIRWWWKWSYFHFIHCMMEIFRQLICHSSNFKNFIFNPVWRAMVLVSFLLQFFMKNYVKSKIPEYPCCAFAENIRFLISYSASSHVVQISVKPFYVGIYTYTQISEQVLFSILIEIESGNTRKNISWNQH